MSYYIIVFALAIFSLGGCLPKPSVSLESKDPDFYKTVALAGLATPSPTVKPSTNPVWSGVKSVAALTQLKRSDGSVGEFGLEDRSERLIAIDSIQNLYVASFVNLSHFPNTSSLGEWDLALTKFDSLGQSVWSKQLGLTPSGTKAGVKLEPQSISINIANIIHVLSVASGAGSIAGITPNMTFFTVHRFNTSGGLLSTTVYAGRAGSQGVVILGKAIAADKDGNFYVAGEMDGNLSSEPSFIPEHFNSFFLVKFNAAGTVLWERILDPGSSGASITLMDNGSVTIAGYVYSMGQIFFDNTPLGAPLGARPGYFLINFDSAGNNNGSTVQALNYPSVEVTVSSVTSDANNNIYVAGTSTQDLSVPPNGTPKPGAFFAKYDASLKNQWVRFYAGPDASASSSSKTISLSSTGKIYLSGQTAKVQNNVANTKLFLNRYSPDGQTLEWSKNYSSANNNSGVSNLNIVTDPSNSIFGVFQNAANDAQGQTFLGGTPPIDISLIKYNADGQLQ